jgi:DNA-binding HxlR family transcriptional regulator
MRSFLGKIFRCDCPVTTALDVVGDKWTLVIIKQMLLEFKKTFKDFSESDEAIAPNILSARLKNLEHFGFIKKTIHPNNKKTNIYILTKKGLSLTPIIISLATWTHENLKKSNHSFFDKDYTQINDKNNLQQEVIKIYEEKTSIDLYLTS